MVKSLLSLFLLCTVVFSFSFAGSGNKKKGGYEEPLLDNKPVDLNAPFNRVPAPDWSRMTSAVGTFTTLTGFYDYQSNGGSVQHIRVNPANGNIHTVMMMSDDSTAAGLNTARRTAYAFSTNGGVSWNNFSNIRVPATRSGFPTLDLVRGSIAGSPVIANHPDGTPTIATLHIDSPEGTGAFASISPPALGQALEPIWPYVASASDGSLIVVASQNDLATTGNVHYNRLQNDYSTWGTWNTWPGDTQSGGRNVVQGNGTGRVGILLNTSNGTAVLGNRWIESTNNGVSWAAPVNVYGTRSAGADTFNAYVHADFVYNGDTPLYAFTEYHTAADRNDVNIVFWSQATGFRIAVPYDTTKYFFDPINQRFHAFNLGWPTIGLSGNTIVIAYQGFQSNVDNRAYNYSDLWYVASSNGGTTWGAPQRITNTTNLDERYPSVSKWNAPGQFNMVWTQKSQSGLYAFAGGADTVRTFQMFLRVDPIVFTTTSVGENGEGITNSFKLSQNYPNPFNPATRIDYTVARAGQVSIKVFNSLGQEVATVLNQDLAPGNYQTTFDGGNLANGVYVYKMTAGSYSESRKMLLLR